MLDKTRTICGRNGRNSDFVQNEKAVNPLKIRIYSQRVSSTNVPKSHFVHQYDGVPFGKLNFTMFLFCRMFWYVDKFRKIAHSSIADSLFNIEMFDKMSPETPGVESTGTPKISATLNTMLAGILVRSGKQIGLPRSQGIRTLADFLFVLTQGFLNYFGFVLLHEFEKLLVKVNIYNWHGNTRWQRCYINIYVDRICMLQYHKVYKSLYLYRYRREAKNKMKDKCMHVLPDGKICGKKVEAYKYICDEHGDEQEMKPYGRYCEECGIDTFNERHHKKGCSYSK